jgi:hypothetical protein
MARSKNPHLAVNTLVAAMVKAKHGPDRLIRCSGYVGESGIAGKVRLYLTVRDLSQYIQFEESAIVRTSALRRGRVFIWVKANARIRAVRARTMEARALAAVVAQNRRVRRLLLLWRKRATQRLR